jgi:hypothetical protein
LAAKAEIFNRLANSEIGCPCSSSIYKSIAIPSSKNQVGNSGISLFRYMYQNDPVEWSERYSGPKWFIMAKILYNRIVKFKEKIKNFFQNLDRAIGRVYIHNISIAKHFYFAIT